MNNDNSILGAKYCPPEGSEEWYQKCENARLTKLMEEMAKNPKKPILCPEGLDIRMIENYGNGEYRVNGKWFKYRPSQEEIDAAFAPTEGRRL